MTAIVSDDDVRGGAPRVEGTRITVLDVKRRVIDEGEDPHVVAGEYDLSMADLFHALAHYYDNREAMSAHERAARADREEGEQRTRDLLARVADAGESSERAD